MTTAICIGGPLAGRMVSKPKGCESFRAAADEPLVVPFAKPDKAAPNASVELLVYRLRRMTDGGLAWVVQ